MLYSLPISQLLLPKSMLVGLVSVCVCCRIVHANDMQPHFRGKTVDVNNRNDAVDYSSVSRSLAENEKSSTFTIVIAIFFTILVITVLLLLVACINMSTKLQRVTGTKQSESGNDTGSSDDGLSSSSNEQQKNNDPKIQNNMSRSVKTNFCDQTIADASLYTTGNISETSLSIYDFEAGRNTRTITKVSNSTKTPVCDQTIADASLYTIGNTHDETNLSIYDVESDRKINPTIRIDGVSELSYVEDAHNSYDELSPEEHRLQMEQYNHYNDLIISKRMNVVDGKTESAIDSESDRNINPKIRIIDGLSVLSYLESANNAYEELSPEELRRQMEEYNHYHDRIMSKRMNVVDGRTESIIDPSLISVYSMDQFYPDDDDVTAYHTTTRTSSEPFVDEDMTFDMSVVSN